MSTIRKIILTCMLAGTFFWLVPEARDKEFLYIVLAIALPSLLLSTLAIGWIFRIKGILRAFPEKPECIDKHTLRNIRAIYLRPITSAAKIANLPWSLNTLSGSAAGEIGGALGDRLSGWLLASGSCSKPAAGYSGILQNRRCTPNLCRLRARLGGRLSI